MKILVEKVWWIFTCRVCKSKCQAEPTDVNGQANNDSDGDTINYIPIVACGKCGAEHKVPPNKMTPKIFNLAQLKGREKK